MQGSRNGIQVKTGRLGPCLPVSNKILMLLFPKGLCSLTPTFSKPSSGLHVPPWDHHLLEGCQHPCSRNVCTSCLLPRPFSLAAQPTPAQIIPWQGTIYEDVEETGGVGKVRKHRTQRSHLSPLPPVYLPGPTSLRTYYVPGTGSILSAFIWVSFSLHINPLRNSSQIYR